MRRLLAGAGALPAALALYLVLAIGMRGFGVVGEVAAAWTRGPPPRVAVALDGGLPVWSDPGLTPNAGHALGPLRASQTRPVERAQVGGLWVPLAVNAYTGGLADWPARVVHGVTGDARAVLGLHVLYGAVLLVAVHRLVRPLSRSGADLAALVLAADWAFVFYRRVLGGTEALLEAAGLALLAGVAARRWRGREVAVGLALGLGLQAKATFACTALAIGIGALSTRRDRAPGDEAPFRWSRVLCWAALPVSPLAVALLHGLALPAAPRVWSHDSLSMQVIRLVGGLGALFDGGPTPAREVPASLAWLLLDPLAWFPGALGTAVPTPWGAWPRAVGWLACLAGVALAWRGRREAPEPDTMLLRLLSLAVPLQVLSLWLANRDLHHLAQAAPGLALLAGLAAARVASALIPGAGWRARAFGFALVLPLLAAGVGAQVRVPGLLAGAEARTVTADGQAALLTLVRRAGVTDLWTSDYDLYGVFEVLAPDLRVAHAWGACSASRDRPGLTADLLRAARGGHWLVVRPSAARIYDLAPDDAAVQRAAVQAGVRAEVVGSLADGRGTWARLYAVRDP